MASAASPKKAVQAKNAALNRRLSTLEEAGESVAATPRDSLVPPPSLLPPPRQTQTPRRQAPSTAPIGAVTAPSPVPQGSTAGASSQASPLARPTYRAPSRARGTMQTPHRFTAFSWTDAAAEEPLSVTSQMFNIEASSTRSMDSSKSRDGLIREFQRLRGFDAFGEDVVVSLGRVELHAALRALEKAYIAVRDHEADELAIPEYVADEHVVPIGKAGPGQPSRDIKRAVSAPAGITVPTSRAPTLPALSSRLGSVAPSASPSRAPSALPPPSAASSKGPPLSARSKTQQHPIVQRRGTDSAESPIAFAERMEEAGIVSRQAFTASPDPISKLVATKISVSSVFHLNAHNMEEAKRRSFDFLKALYELPEVRAALTSRDAPGSKGFLSGLTALTQIMLTQEPQMINRELPLVPFDGGRKLHPCWDLDLECYSRPPQVLALPVQKLREGSELLSRVVSLCAVGARVYGGTEDGTLHVWHLGNRGPRLLHSRQAHQDAILAISSGESFPTPDELLVSARMQTLALDTRPTAAPSRNGRLSSARAGSARPRSSARGASLLSEGEVDGIQETSQLQLELEEETAADSTDETEEEEEEEEEETEEEEEEGGAERPEIAYRLYTGSMDKKIGVWDVPRNPKRAPLFVCYLSGHWGWVRTVAPSGDYVFSGSGDFTIRSWSASALTCLFTLKIREHWINAISVMGNHLFVASADHSVSLLDLSEDGKPVLREAFEDAHENWVRALAVEDRTLYTCSGDGTIKMWDVPADGRRGASALKPRETVSGHTGKVTSLHVADGRLFSASSTGEIKIWSISSNASPVCVATLRDVWRPVGDGISAVTSADGHIFFAQGTVRWW